MQEQEAGTQDIFALRLRCAREAKGYSRVLLSELCGLRSRAVSDYESGLYAPNVRVLFLLARQLDVTSDYLLGLE